MPNFGQFGAFLQFNAKRQLMLRTALADGGVTFAMEATFRPYIARGELVPVLEGYLPYFPGFYLYFPSRHNMAPKLRVLVDFVKKTRAEGTISQQPCL